MNGLVLTWEARPAVRLRWLGPGAEILARAPLPPSALAAVVGPPGPPGLPGQSGRGLEITAAAPLGGHRAVTADGLHCTPATLHRFAGITTAAAAPGAPVPVQRHGLMTEPSWAWTPEAPIFIGPDGVLTQLAPTGLARRVAWAIGPGTINIDPFPIITLAQETDHGG